MYIVYICMQTKFFKLRLVTLKHEQCIKLRFNRVEIK